MKCPNCGFFNTDDSAFCENCGASLNNGVNDNSVVNIDNDLSNIDSDVVSTVQPDSENKADKEQNRLKIAIIVLAALLAVAVIVIVIVLLLKTSKPGPVEVLTNGAGTSQSYSVTGGNSDNKIETEPENENVDKKSDVEGKNDAFYGILCEAYKDKNATKRDIEKLKDAGFTGAVYCTTSKWANFNDKLWYVVVAGRYSSESLAKANLPAVKKLFPNAYVKYSGKRVYDETTTAAAKTTKASASSSISSAFYAKVEEYEAKYGTFKSTYPYVTGVSYVGLIDFDADGTDELLMVYNNDKNSSDNFNYVVFAYNKGEAVKIADRNVLTGDYDTSKNMAIYYSNDDGMAFIGEVYDYEYEFEKSNLYSKQGETFVRFYDLDAREDKYTLDGEEYSESEFNDMFETEYLNIGHEDTENEIADAKRIIAHMD